jgi:branched-chain amino acid transport system permease protein
MRRDPRLWLLVAVIATVGLSLAAPSIVSNIRGGPYYLGIVIDIGINIILAVSLNLINGHTGQFSLGHAGFMAVGGYMAAKLTLMFGPNVPQSLQPLLFAGALLVGGGVAAVVGVAVGVPSLRLRGDYLAIVTLGFGEIIRVIFQTSETFGAATGLNGIARLTNFAWAWGLAAITVYVVACQVNSTYGRGFIAVHDDEIAATAMGINPVRYKVTAFVVGAFFAGIAGGLYAHHKLVLKPDGFDFIKSIEIVVMVILGGMGRTAGVILAAIILTVLPELLRGVAEYRMIIYSLLILGLMLTRPQGLFTFGKKGAKA